MDGKERAAAKISDIIAKASQNKQAKNEAIARIKITNCNFVNINLNEKVPRRLKLDIRLHSGS